MAEFLGIDPSLEDYWRSIILFGKNVACYKFALGKALLDLAPTGKSIITSEELAEPYSRYVTEHLHLCEAQSQTTQTPYPFLEACRQFNQGEITKEQLIQITAEEGFKVVFSKFHNLNSGEIPVHFYHKQRRRITLTDDLFRLVETEQFQNLIQEVEARWRLVETAWKLKISKHLIQVNYDYEQEMFFTGDRLNRVAVTSCRDALNGYQKGKCFYCFNPISIEPGSKDLTDVDHFFPHFLGQYIKPIDSVWNLVLACQRCNRGEKGKFERLPHLRYLERLHKRNEFFINSNLPLKDTLIQQTGNSEPTRRYYLQSNYNEAQRLLATSLSMTWETIEYNTAF